MFNNNKVYIALINLILAIGIVGCGDENKSMYEIKEVPKVVEQSVQVGVGQVQAGVSNTADTDKNLGKKQLIMVNGQPIAALVDEYTNENGYTASGMSGNTDEEQEINGIALLELIKLKDTTNVDIIKGLCEKYNISVTTLDITELEKLAESDTNIIVDNAYNVTEMLVATNLDNEYTAGTVLINYLVFDNMDDATDSELISTLPISDRNLLVIEHSEGEYSNVLDYEVDETCYEFYYMNIEKKYILICLADDAGKETLENILNEMGIK